jgi:hypothetical protein
MLLGTLLLETRDCFRFGIANSVAMCTAKADPYALSPTTLLFNPSLDLFMSDTCGSLLRCAHRVAVLCFRSKEVITKLPFMVSFMNSGMTERCDP